MVVCRQGLKDIFKQAEKADKSVKLPELPRRMIELLPAEGVSGPTEPPVATTLRACLFVDCTSSQKPQHIGVHTLPESTMVDVKKAVAHILGMNFNEQHHVCSFYFTLQCIKMCAHSLMVPVPCPERLQLCTGLPAGLG